MIHLSQPQVAKRYQPVIWVGIFASFVLLGHTTTTEKPYKSISHSLKTSHLGDPSQAIQDLVVPYGYPLEEHFVTTEDGYILRMYRIPHAPSSKAQQQGHRKQAHGTSRRYLHDKLDGLTELLSGSRGEQPQQRLPVLLQHGLLDSCAGFLLSGPGQALALLLADAGYDVWLANTRGNTQSRNHTQLSTWSAQFWAFSFDEMARYDLPAELDYIAAKTAQEQVHYIGHSQGTTILLAALASQPELNNRIKLAVLLAPVAFPKHISSVPLLALATMNTDLVFGLLGIHEFMPSQRVVSYLEGKLCTAEPQLCVNILSAISGYNYSNVNGTRLPLYLQFTPAGTSVQNLAHWAQAVRRAAPNTLVHFDWGTDCAIRKGRSAMCNQIKYGAPDPPLYNLNAIQTPLALFSGGHDRLADPLDVEFLLESLKEGVVTNEVIIHEYEHLDFIWGLSAKQLVYEPIIQLLSQSDAS
mmetsp:Transcript_11111/g.23956  ORF Transcript_11111/g.23956 Transcript_11111/m.23956 type:complete len:469 (+) Transcript_11111:194-1600(+)|eukprot:CAMPEP_0202911356 /NCGR_PEP_ID=MMETSP1392-20130828/54756_1 /ASSEMBLY_ACC=CAM_ASM_000868 /TAXON_ID=225041 /ORGANISM="Chlamydomonas chlamydogama, Strain SAG 11-48b" /LENGTH=468 /DNA_ID=CAMNT_0049601835 /DNA_START=174 /DNA_END=1580 /DNA_ORIENTATION=+